MATLPKQNLKKLAVILHDLAVTALAIWLVFVVRFEGAQLVEHLRYLPRFLADPRMVLAICFTEPETSSDYIVDGPEFRFRTNAVQQPDGSWLLNGYKHYISNGADAPRWASGSRSSRPADAARRRLK